MTPDLPDETGEPTDRPADLRDLAEDGHCREVLEEVWPYLDGEIDPTGRTAIEAHLDDCAPCLRKYGLERVVKALVARTCGREDTPSTLRAKVLTSLRSVTVETDGGSVQITSSTTTVVSEQPH